MKYTISEVRQRIIIVPEPEPVPPPEKEIPVNRFDYEKLRVDPAAIDSAVLHRGQAVRHDPSHPRLRLKIERAVKSSKLVRQST
jgi:hypothetical protein